MEHIKTQSGGHVVGDRKHAHETSDVNIRAIIGFGIFLAVSGIVLHIALLGFYRVLDHIAEQRNPEPNPMMVQAAPPQHRGGMMQTGTMTAETEEETAQRLNKTFGGNANTPMLQVDDVRDMNMMRKMQTTQMEEYQWINKDTGSVRIPIERAMELIAQRGPNVPVTTAPAAGQKPRGQNPGAASKPASAQKTVTKPASQTVKR